MSPSDAPAPEPLSSADDRTAARRRAWAAFAALAAGVWLSRAMHAGAAGPPTNLLPDGVPLSVFLFGAAGLCSAAAFVLPPRATTLALALAATALGAAVHTSRVCERPPDNLLRLVGPTHHADPPPLVRIEGRITGRPTRDAQSPGSLDEMLTRFGRAPTRLPVRIDTAHLPSGPVRASGTVNIYATGLDPGATDDPRATPGARIALTGLLHTPKPAANPGASDPRAWAAQSGSVGWIATDADAIEPLPPRGPADRLAALPVRAAAALRSVAVRTLQEDARTPAGTITAEMLLGEGTPDRREQARFARTGIAHLLAISGFHLALLVGLVVGAIRLTGDRPRLEAVVGLVFILLYATLVPARTPIIRAALLASAVLLAHCFARRWDKGALLGWVAAGLVLWRPLDLFTLGFQLTVGVTALLIMLLGGHHPWIAGPEPLLGEPIDGRAGPVWWVRRFVRTLAVTSVLVWLVTAPVIAYHLGTVNPLTPIAVIVATPIASLLQATGLAGLAVSPFSDALGGLLLGLAHHLGGALAGVVGVMETLPGHTVLAPLSLAWTVSAVALAIAFIRRARLRDPALWAAAAVVLAWLAVEASSRNDLSEGVSARVDALHVGDGSCLLVRVGEDAVLWDAGSLRPGLGVRTIPRALRELGAPRVRTALVTHANIDHYAALPDAAPSIGLERVLVSAPALETMRTAAEGSAEAVFLGLLDALGVVVEPVSAGDSVPIGGAELEILWPAAGPPERIITRNDRSLVARLSVETDGGPRRVLLTGDIQRAAMLSVLERATEPLGVRADVLELPHHGSHHAAAERFFAEVAPVAVLQSTGPSRLGDERWGGALRSVLGRGGAWSITARDGAVFAEILDDGRVRSGPSSTD